MYSICLIFVFNQEGDNKDKMKKIQIWVAPEFKQKLQKKAIDEGLNLLEYTTRISSDNSSDIIGDCFKAKKIKKVNFFNGYE